MPCITPQPPLLVRIIYWLKLIWMNNSVKLYLFLRRIYRYGYYVNRPTFTHTVSQRTLPSYWSPSTVEVYLPPYKSPSSKKCPLLFDIHGGGFALGHPTLDSQFNRYISNAASCIVVALPYRKGPLLRWPVQIKELTALVEVVLQDVRISHLYDPERVAAAGFSAGGNLATVLAIQPSLKGRIQSIVPIYPVLDWTITPADKLAMRPSQVPADVLRETADIFTFGYIPAGQDREHPNLSPLYADPEDLPENIYLVGCEYDMLNIDCINFYRKFGKLKRNVVYKEIKGAKHGFTHQNASRIDIWENKRLDKLTVDLYGGIAEWLGDIWGEEKKTPHTPDVEKEGGFGDHIILL
ncbi:hypothetical protein TWF696_008821 [Orbilia brochopaga]|uniref:Alpha/beta hydrolase fold-3 domain-containing protein n=1 Tax=Orbilia brochopaga TaxID=3140254 RepID=A0AAV9UEV4_9PEZI